MEREPNQTKLHVVRSREGLEEGELKEIMKPNQQLYWETIWLLLSRGKIEKKTKPNQVARGLELGPLGKENQTKPSCTWCGVGAPG